MKGLNKKEKRESSWTWTSVVIVGEVGEGIEGMKGNGKNKIKKF